MKKYKMKKYKITNKTKKMNGITLHRIKALKDFGDVKKGELGGWIEKKENLSQDGNCWVYDDGFVYNNGKIYDDSKVLGNGWVWGNGVVCDNAIVGDCGSVFGNAKIYDNGKVSGNGIVCYNGIVCGNGTVCGNGKVSGNGVVSNFDIVCDDGEVSCRNDVITIDNIGSRNGSITFYRTKNGDINVKCGCFCGTLDEFEKAVEEEHGNNKFAKEYKLAIELAKMHIWK